MSWLPATRRLASRRDITVTINPQTTRAIPAGIHGSCYTKYTHVSFHAENEHLGSKARYPHGSMSYFLFWHEAPSLINQSRHPSPRVDITPRQAVYISLKFQVESLHFHGFHALVDNRAHMKKKAVPEKVYVRSDCMQTISGFGFANTLIISRLNLSRENTWQNAEKFSTNGHSPEA